MDDASERADRLPDDNRGQLIKAFVHSKLQEHPEKLGLLVSEYAESLKSDPDSQRKQVAKSELEDLKARAQKIKEERLGADEVPVQRQPESFKGSGSDYGITYKP